jgi:hypothetical protein
MLSVLRGEVAGARLSDRIEAATWLADRGFGRPGAAMSPDQVQSERISVELIRALCSDSEQPNAQRVYDV